MGKKNKNTLPIHPSAPSSAVDPAGGNPPAGAFLRFRWFFERFGDRPGARSLMTLICLGIILVIGFLFRIEDLSTWKKASTRAFHQNEPLHTTFDAWFYLSLAQDLVDGEYTEIDRRRGVPDTFRRPWPPPLLSVLAAGAVNIFPVSMNGFAAFLPAILGPLLAIPIFLLGRHYGGTVAGLTAALLAVLYPIYVFRSNIGRFDTDCMNVTWAVLAAVLFMKFGLCKTRGRYLFLAGGMLVFALFLWWWDQAPDAVTVIVLLPFGVALLFFYRPPKNEMRIFWGLLAVCLLCVCLWKGIDYPVRIADSLISKFRYVAKDNAELFPNIGIAISEQKKPSLDQIILSTTHGMFGFMFGIAGFLLLVWRHLKRSLFLSAFLALSLLAVTTANRFLIFMIPILAIGSGFAMSELWRYRKKVFALYGVCPVLLLVIVPPLVQANRSQVQWPKEPGYLVDGMVAAKAATPENAVIWAWWDHGYALTYFGRRATINDGSIHSGERTVYTALPYTTDNFRFAANFMQFYTVRGLDGLRLLPTALNTSRAASDDLLRQILSAGPEAARAIIEPAPLSKDGPYRSVDDWLGFFFPKPERPIYLFVDTLLTRTADWWFWFGTWHTDAKNGVKPKYFAFHNIETSDGIYYRAGDALSIDAGTGTGFLSGKPVRISHLATRTDAAFTEKTFDPSSPYRFEVIPNVGFGALMDDSIAESVFNKLFVRHAFDAGYFTPVLLRSPVYQLWKVTGDRFSAG